MAGDCPGRTSSEERRDNAAPFPEEESRRWADPCDVVANLGYAVVATDYYGLGADSGKPVLDMQSNALDVMYSVLAARAAVKEIGPKWIAVGSFQGGSGSSGGGGERSTRSQLSGQYRYFRCA